MKAVRISVREGQGKRPERPRFDLKDILECCGQKFREHDWIALGVQWNGWNHRAPAELIDEWTRRTGMHSYSRVELISYAEIEEYARWVVQTIDGLFAAVRPDTQLPSWIEKWADIIEISEIAIMAHDSSWFEVMTCDEECIERLKRRFPDAAMIPRRDWTLK